MGPPKLKDISRAQDTRIIDLPNELLLLIADNLSVRDLSHLVSTSRRLSSLLTPVLYNSPLQVGPGFTVLDLAALRGDASLAELAISKGAKVDEPNRMQRGGTGTTPLHRAAQYNSPNVIRVLVKHGARINATNNITLETPIFWAAVWLSAEAVRVLLELGADMTCANKWGETPAHISAALGDIGSMGNFIGAGLDFHLKGWDGQTVLHDALVGDEEIVQYLLGQGMGRIINVPDSAGRTPLHEVVALRRGTDLARLLLRHGADMEVKDNRGRTAVDLAIGNGNDSMARALLEFRENALDRE